MEITKKELKEWKSIKDHGDFVKIAKASGIHVVTVQTSFKKRKCSIALYEAFTKFFAERKEEIKHIQKPTEA